MRFMISALRRISCPVLASALLVVPVGCKPAASPDAGHSHSSGDNAAKAESNAPRQPTQEDFTAFFQGTMSSWVRLAEVKMDPSVLMPNTSPSDHVWLCKVKITLVPTEDLFVLPSPEDVQAIDGLVNELNSLVAWRNLYVKSPYVRACGDLEIKVPASSAPQLLVVRHAKGKPLPPVYGKMAAEWQVDHWQFSVVDMNLSVDGKPRSDYPGNTMAKGSAEAEGFLKSERDAIAQARKEIEAIKGRYAEQVANSTKSGTAYQGRVTFRQNVQPCEVRFVDSPPGADGHFASLEVKLPNENPPCVFTYNARIKTELPIPVPGSQPTQENTNPIFDLNASGQPLAFNVRVSLVRSVGKMDERTLPGQILSGNRHDTGSQTLLLLSGHLEGVISYYNAPGIIVSVQQVKPAQ